MDRRVKRRRVKYKWKWIKPSGDYSITRQVINWPFHCRDHWIICPWNGWFSCLILISIIPKHSERYNFRAWRFKAPPRKSFMKTHTYVCVLRYFKPLFRPKETQKNGPKIKSRKMTRTWFSTSGFASGNKLLRVIFIKFTNLWGCSSLYLEAGDHVRLLALRGIEKFISSTYLCKFPNTTAYISDSGNQGKELWFTEFLKVGSRLKVKSTWIGNLKTY